MFKFFKKNKKPEVKFWSIIPGLEEIVPPVDMKECTPEWFKSMPRDIDPSAMLHPGTVKRCPSFVDYFSQGYVIKLWCDLAVSIRKDRTYEVYSPENIFKFENHGDEQFLDYIPNREEFNYSMVLKAFCPWRIITPPGYSIMQLPLTYDFNKDFTVLPGTIWTDIHHEVNQQIVFRGYGEYILKRGTPLAVYIPYKREKYDFKVIPQDTELNYKNLISYYWWAGKFKNGYKEHQTILRQGEKNDR